MPALVAGAEEEGGAADRRADRARVDEPPRLLVGAAEEGVGRAADPEAAGVRRLDDAGGLGEGDAERLLGMDVLAGRDRLQADRGMGLRHRQVQDDLDRRIGEEVGDRDGRYPELGPARRGRRRVQVGDGAQVEDRESAAPPSDRRR